MPELVSVGPGRVFSLPEIKEVAEMLLLAGACHRVWAFYGEMGAGKTTLIRALMAATGVSGVVASPTFSLVNQYQTAYGAPVYHFDFYRIKNEPEAFDIGTAEYFDSGDWCLVEWPQKIPSLLPATYFEIHLEMNAEQTRILSYRNHA